MKKSNKYTKEFSNYMSIMNEALKKGDFAVYEYAKQMLDETIDDCKEEKKLMNEMKTVNFGKLNHIFEEALPTLLKTNKKAVKNVIKTIKEDKNLMGEFNFYNLIKKSKSNIIEGISCDEILKQIEETVNKAIDKSTIKESNKKLMNVMVKSGVVPLSKIDEESNKLYENGNKLLVNESKLTNLFDMQRSRKSISNYMESHMNDVIKESTNPEKLISDYENKLKENLTESEISFVQQITDFRTPIAEQRKEKLFNKLKNECIGKIDEMLKEDSDNSELKALKSQLEEQKFNKDSIVKDVAKLLEIRDILMDD